MTEQSDDSKSNLEVEEELPPLDDFDRGERAALVLGEMGLSGKQNEILLVSCRVMEFTVEAKVNDGNYGSSRGYVRLEPEDLRLHVPVYNPGQLVTDAGNAGLFGQVYRYLARELDLSVFDTASRRLDVKAVIQDQKDERKGGVKIGQASNKSKAVPL